MAGVRTSLHGKTHAKQALGFATCVPLFGGACFCFGKREPKKEITQFGFPHSPKPMFRPRIGLRFVVMAGSLFLWRGDAVAIGSAKPVAIPREITIDSGFCRLPFCHIPGQVSLEKVPDSQATSYLLMILIYVYTYIYIYLHRERASFWALKWGKLTSPMMKLLVPGHLCCSPDPCTPKGLGFALS